MDLMAGCYNVHWTFSVEKFDDYLEHNLITVSPIDPILFSVDFVILLGSCFCY
jgi:hypothetical protein